MKKKYLLFGICIPVIAVLLATRPAAKDANGMVKGNPDIRSISALAFNDAGILFIGDSKNASVIAIDTKDNRKAPQGTIAVQELDQQVAAALGTTKENISITDMAVNPASGRLYLAVQHSNGTPALLKLENNKLLAVPLTDIPYASVTLNDAYAEDAKDNRGRPLRVSTISDIAFSNGKLLVSGLSNREFSSTFRSIAFPFGTNQDQATLEIYHASHGRYETASPVRTFTTGNINGKEYLIASYTCTPLVLFPMDELKPGTHVKGRTVAEMGSGNTPIDMITLSNNKQTVLIMANTSKPVARVDYKDIAAFEGTLTEKVSGTAGTSFAQLPLTGVVQLDKLDNNHLVVLQKKPNGQLDLFTVNQDGVQ